MCFRGCESFCADAHHSSVMRLFVIRDYTQLLANLLWFGYMEKGYCLNVTFCVDNNIFVLFITNNDHITKNRLYVVV